MLESVKKQRESSIELLRVFAAMGVVFSHLCNSGGLMNDFFRGETI